MRISVTSVFVADQAKALEFYTDVLGFTKRQDIPMGAARWLTVASSDAPDAVELLLEPNANPIASTYQQSLHAAGIPATTFATDDLAKEHERLTALGVRFTQEPVRNGPVSTAVLDDTCGNLIGLHQVH
ncbi:VOC family protein [Micromonospora echinofusca]|uniref:VOC family protein n=1 Tax=Micromonospora echinofusca TaxID=47858 RepID=A0ABS3VUQ3_MICEH|nr:VOC family protein [Micromonospora echinofusca]MBO4208253.1 VOC family protein [Micromonospora echinofusca]